MNQPTIVTITSVQQEAPSIKTITFPYQQTTIPGQFFMIWIPGVDEIPMSVSRIDPKEKSFTFKPVGEATNILDTFEKGDQIGIRGPYGNGFTLQGSHHLFIGGGTGIAMIAPAVELCLKRNEPVDVIIGAKTKDELFFTNRLEQTKATVHVTTDDDSLGHKGYASDLAAMIINEKPIDIIYSCGPELMMKTLYSLCIQHDIMFQASLERYMKCAVGICGQCCIGEGLRVCKEGPIFSQTQLKHITEFGRFTRDASGKKKPFIL